jgi:hypothetical protein
MEVEPIDIENEYLVETVIDCNEHFSMKSKNYIKMFTHLGSNVIKKSDGSATDDTSLFLKVRMIRNQHLIFLQFKWQGMKI